MAQLARPPGRRARCGRAAFAAIVAIPRIAGPASKTTAETVRAYAQLLAAGALCEGNTPDQEEEK
jgi:hypothetical protein